MRKNKTKVKPSKKSTKSTKKTNQKKTKTQQPGTPKKETKAKNPVVKAEKVAAPSPKKEEPKYEFKHFYESETQLRGITHTSPPEEIVQAYSRLIWVHASNHVREGVEVEDLVAEGQRGICEAIKEFNDPKRKRPTYNFHQACLYKIRSSIFQYCLRNATQIKTPYYIQRGCMHVGQIFKLMMANQNTAETVLKRKGPASEQDIIDFLYDEKERLPVKPKKFIEEQITKPKNTPEFKQIYSGIMNHELGSRHSYVKNNLTDVGKILHIKEKLWYTATSNNMNYARVISLILSARQSKTELNPSTYSPHGNDMDSTIVRREMLEHGNRLCGEKNFEIFVQNKLYDKTYDELSKIYKLKKPVIIDIIKECIKSLRKDEQFIEMFNSL